MRLLFVCVLSFLLLNGCMDKYHAFDFNSTSNAQCAVECEDLMRDYYCFEALPSYQSSYTNGNKISGICSCYIRACRE